MSLKIEIRPTDAIRVKLTVKGGLQRYLEAFLAIHNVVRDERDLYAVENFEGTDIICVYASPDEEEALVEWLEQFGDVGDIVPAIAWVSDWADYDFDTQYGSCVAPAFF